MDRQSEFVQESYAAVKEIGSGVWSLRYGALEKLTPFSVQKPETRMDALKEVDDGLCTFPFPIDEIRFKKAGGECPLHFR